MKKRLIALVVFAGLVGCRPAAIEESAPEPTEEQVARAESAANALVEELGGRLIAELEDSGPLGAIEVCSEVAQKIAHRQSRDGLLVRRVSLRVRNPANQASAWVGRQLELWEREVARGKTPRAVSAVAQPTDSDGAYGRELWYLRPLIVAPPCLNCHGVPEEMAPAVVARLADLYPADEAIGYTLGDLRGAVSVRLALDGQQELPILGPGEAMPGSHRLARQVEG